MTKKGKLISGLTERKTVQESNKYFSDEEKHLIIQEWQRTGCTKREIWKKYTGQEEEHGHILRWMRKLGYGDCHPIRKTSFAPKQRPVKEKKHKGQEMDSFETLQLKKRVEELEKQLKDAEMRSIAYSTMVDIAEKEFGIAIRKKSNTKPSKK